VFIYVDEEGLTELLQFFNLINISKQNSWHFQIKMLY
jgi:hypothetical protein